MAHADARVLGTPRAAAQLAADLGSLLSAVAPSSQNVARLFGVDEEEEPVAVMPPLDLRAGPSVFFSRVDLSVGAGKRPRGRASVGGRWLEGVPRRRMRRRRLGPPPHWVDRRTPRLYLPQGELLGTADRIIEETGSESLSPSGSGTPRKVSESRTTESQCRGLVLPRRNGSQVHKTKKDPAPGVSQSR